MATKGFNPFLSEADYTAPAAAEAPSNPFLQDFGAPQEKPFGGGNDNPFFNPFGAPAPPTTTVASSSAAFMFSDTSSNAGGGNPFASFVDSTPAPTSTSSNGPFSAVDTDSSALWDAPPPPAPGPAVTQTIFMMDTRPDEQISLFDSGPSGDDSPLRPPPSSVPQTTKELLDSVTGALEANSESLMDRLRLNQPSPINLAPSPSPSPRSPSPDLLGDEPPPPPPSSANPLQPSPNQVDSILDLFDQPVPTGPKTTMDILGLYYTGSTTVAPSMPPATTTAPTFIPTTAPPSFIPMQSEPVGPEVIGVEIPAVNHAPPEIQMPIIDMDEITSPAVEIPPTQPSKVEEVQPQAPPLLPQVLSPEITRREVTSNVVIQESVSPVRAPPPERPKPPPVPPNKSPMHENKPFPTRPPPPVPPAPRVSPQPHGPPPAIPPQPMFPTKPDLPPAPPHPQPAPPTVPSHPHPPPPTVPSHPHPPPPTVPHHPHPAPPAVPSHPHVFHPPAAPSHAPFAPQPFASPVVPEPITINAEPIFPVEEPIVSRPIDLFGKTTSDAPFASASATTDIVVNSPAFQPAVGNETKATSAFDDFDAKFNSISEVDGASTNAFGDPFTGAASSVAPATDAAWGSSSGGFDDAPASGFGGDAGFGGDSGFDSFLHMTEPPPVPQSTPAKAKREDGEEDDRDEQDLSIFIRPKGDNELNFGLAPALAPPPKSPAISTNSAYSEDSANTAFVPFLSSARDTTYDKAAETTQLNRTDSQETPQTPLFEEDTSQPLEEFPRTKFEADGWEMHMRHPNKKKITGQRFWKKVYVRIVVQNDIPIIHIFNTKGDKDPFQEIPLQPCYSVSDIGAQQFDQYGKIFTVKIQYVFYKERPGVRPGQISKAGRISDKLSQFAAYAIQGDYQGVKEFGSDLKKLGLPLEHAPQISQLVKLGTQTYEEMKQFSASVEEALFRLGVHRDRALQYKTEEIQVTLVDEVYTEQDVYGVVIKQIARVRLFFLSFLSGVAEVEMGLNDLRRQGKEVVGRHDIIPIATEEWIRTEAIEFSNCVQLDEYEATQTIKFKPPDASYIELLRFRVRPPRHRELPLQVKTTFTTTGSRVEIRSDILVPGFTSRKLGQIPCEDVMVRFPIPECWIYMFRVEKHFRYGSVKSAHRRSGKVKGIERFLGAVEAVEHSLMEVTSGQAKYEHQHRSIVWRIARLPKEGQGAYTTHSFFCHITMQAHEQLPENLSKYCYVEFTMPHTTVSHTVCRSIAVPSCDDPPEKCVRYLSRHEYQIEIEHTQGFAPATYNLAAAVKKDPEPAIAEAAPVDPTDSWFPTEKPKDDDDSDFSD